jgi:hypothetical protein
MLTVVLDKGLVGRLNHSHELLNRLVRGPEPWKVLSALVDGRHSQADLGLDNDMKVTGQVDFNIRDSLAGNISLQVDAGLLQRRPIYTRNANLLEKPLQQRQALLKRIAQSERQGVLVRAKKPERRIDQSVVGIKRQGWAHPATSVTPGH